MSCVSGERRLLIGESSEGVLVADLGGDIYLHKWKLETNSFLREFKRYIEVV